MRLNNFIGFIVHCISLLCWVAGKYLLINVNEENHEAISGESDNELHQWKGMEDDEIISLYLPFDSRTPVSRWPQVNEPCVVDL